MVNRELKKVQDERPQDRLARAHAEKIEMENAVQRGLLISAAQIEPKLAAAFEFARERWVEAPPRLAREMPEDIRAREQMLQSEFESFLHHLADWANADQSDDEEA